MDETHVCEFKHISGSEGFFHCVGCGRTITQQEAEFIISSYPQVCYSRENLIKRAALLDKQVRELTQENSRLRDILLQVRVNEIEASELRDRAANASRAIEELRSQVDEMRAKIGK